MRHPDGQLGRPWGCWLSQNSSLSILATGRKCGRLHLCQERAAEYAADQNCCFRKGNSKVGRTQMGANGGNWGITSCILWHISCTRFSKATFRCNTLQQETLKICSPGMSFGRFAYHAHVSASILHNSSIWGLLGLPHIFHATRLWGGFMGGYPGRGPYMCCSDLQSPFSPPLTLASQTWHTTA